MTGNYRLQWEESNPGHPNVPVGVYPESNFAPPTPECPHPEYWSTHDAQATEIEVIELVHGLIRGLQPEVVLETGTSRGFMALSIAKALKRNGHGQLITYEPDVPTSDESIDTLVGYLVHDDVGQVHAMNEASMSPWEYGPIDFAWFDSDIPIRHTEFEFYYPHMSPRCVVGFHDTSPRFGDWAEALYRDPRMFPMSLPTPRGLVLARVAK